MDSGSFEVRSSRYKALDAEILPLPGAGRRQLTNFYGTAVTTEIQSES